MKTYRQKFREFGISWGWHLTKGQLKQLIKDHNHKEQMANNKRKIICEKLNCNMVDLQRTCLSIDDLSKFVNFRNRLPTMEESKAINRSLNFKFWFNKEMNGDYFNSVWVFPSEIQKLYNSL